MANSLRAKLSKLRHDRHITEEEYQELIKKLDGHDAQVRAEFIADLEQRLRFWDNKANAIPEYVWHCINAMKEQKLCSNGKTCTHPNCKRCGITHFMSECDYGKEQKNE